MNENKTRMIFWRSAMFACSLLAISTSATADKLFKESNYKSLTADKKAGRVGDILTVQVFENSSASTSSDTGTRRKNNVSAELQRDGGSLKQVGVGVNGEFDGGGKTQRANRLLATISVTVKAVNDNGDLIVSGQQVLTVNDESQRVNVEGRVRAVDISDTNTVLSTRLADAKITYVGEGELTERQRRGFWRKVLDWFGL